MSKNKLLIKVLIGILIVFLMGYVIYTFKILGV